MTPTNTEALRLADAIECSEPFTLIDKTCNEAAAELRRLSAVEAERDALRAALSDAATSLETIGRLAGKPYYGLDDKGEPIPTYMGHNDEVRSYANSRAGAARAAMKGTQ